MSSVLETTALTTLSSLKDELGIATADTSQDSRLERIINRVTGWIEANTNRKLKARNYNGKGTAFSTTGITSEDYIYFDGSTSGWGGNTVQDQRGYGKFFLPAYPILSGSFPIVAFSLQLLTDRPTQTWDSTVYVENTNFVVDYDAGIVSLLWGSFVPGIKNYRISCTAGLLSGSAQPYVPSSLEGLCLELCKQMYRESRTLQAEQIGTWSRTFDVQVKDPYLQDVMGAYTRVIV